MAATAQGLFCPAGGFHIDPLRPVARAVVTHAHSDHARGGSQGYLCSRSGEGVLRERIGADATIETLEFGERRTIGGVAVSLHPAGHLLGSAQVRIERKGYVCVVTGDFKRQPDRTCEAFEPVPCHALFPECTFGLPVYRWPDPEAVADEINRWWRGNAREGTTSVVFAYALGKAQRILSLLDESIGPIGVHGAVARFSPHYRKAGVRLAAHEPITAGNRDRFKGGGLAIAPGSAAGTPWLRKFGRSSLAFASGWMAIRGNRRRRALDRGFVLSDHADWPELHATVRETGASFVGAMHGFTDVFVRSLREQGLQAEEVSGYRERSGEGGD